MKRLLGTLGFLLVFACAASITPPTITPAGIVIEAQSLPITVHVQIAPPPAAEGVTGAQLVLDGGAPVTVSPLPATTTTCLGGVQSCIKIPITVSTVGAHTVSVAPISPLLSTDPTSTQVGPPVSVTFTINVAAVAFTNATVSQ